MLANKYLFRKKEPAVNARYFHNNRNAGGLVHMLHVTCHKRMNEEQRKIIFDSMVSAVEMTSGTQIAAPGNKSDKKIDRDHDLYFQVNSNSIEGVKTIYESVKNTVEEIDSKLENKDKLRINQLAIRFWPSSEITAKIPKPAAPGQIGLEL